MVDMNMHYSSFIPPEFVTAWVREINEYEMQYKNTLFARNFLPNREVGANIDYDTVTYYNSADRRGQFISKGSIPEPFAARARTAKHEIYQVAEAFVINERDLAKPDGAAMKTKELDIAVRNLHKAEDYTAINGDGMDLGGIVTAARANANGKITTATNMGAWAGSDDSRDPFEDVNKGMVLMDNSFKPMYLLGNRTSLSYLNNMDSERIMFAESVAKLFGKGPQDRSWMVESQYVPDGYVYLMPFDPQAAEFVISEEIDIKDDFSKQPGSNFWIEITEWINPCEIHVPDAFCEIAIG
jgi:hypothetical protein